jgi:copper chaperone CopZ
MLWEAKMRLFGNKGKQIELIVRGMHCEHCEMRVSKALSAVEGVRAAEANHEKGRAVVTLEPKVEVDVAALVAAVEAAGYEAELAG